MKSADDGRPLRIRCDAGMDSPQTAGRIEVSRETGAPSVSADDCPRTMYGRTPIPARTSDSGKSVLRRCIQLALLIGFCVCGRPLTTGVCIARDRNLVFKRFRCKSLFSNDIEVSIVSGTAVLRH